MLLGLGLEGASFHGGHRLTEDAGTYGGDPVEQLAAGLLRAEDLLARCIQHENDHLDGVTIMESSEYFYEDTEEGKKAAREAKGNN